MPTVKMIGGRADGMEIVEVGSPFYKFPVRIEPLQPYADGDMLETKAELYTLRKMRFRGGDSDVSFLAPEEWTDDQAIRYLIRKHKP